MKRILTAVFCILLLLQSLPAACAEETADELETLSLQNIDLDSAQTGGKDKDVINILLLGTDEKLAYTHDIGRSDCTMLVSLNCKTGVVKLISFERGIMVAVPPEQAEGRTSDLLTHAYHWCGAEFMVETIEKYFNVEIDGYAQVDFYEFEEIIDAIGGIDIELEYMEAIMMNHAEPVQTQAHMLLGKNHLNGHDAMVYCRLRSPDDDWARQGRQRKTVQAVIDKVSTMRVTEVVSLLDEVLPLLHMDIPATVIAKLALHAGKFLHAETQQLQVPEKNQASDGSIVCDFAAESDKIKTFLAQ
ncbi:MAG: LCP family protein [Oscillospiraceae bacterium]|nr:LCP family protein [Oscillospiraceae bacterium]